MSKKSLTTFFVGLIIGSVSLSYAAWTGPTQAPPNGNTPAPVNVGNIAQDKVGVLTLGGLGVFGSALITSSAGYTLPSSLQLGVNGKIGAKQYCDEKGNNCVSTLGGTSGTSAAATPHAGDSCGANNSGVRFKGYNNRTVQDAFYCCYLWSPGAVSGGYHDGLDVHMRCDVMYTAN